MKKYATLLLLLFPISAMAENEVATPYSQLSGKQREYYAKVFNYVMDNVKEDQAFNWDAKTGKGTITAGKEYISKSKSLCRDFTETYEIGEKKGEIKASACKRDGNNGWCRITDENPHTCALEEPKGFIDSVTQDVDSALGKGNEMIRNTKDWWHR